MTEDKKFSHIRVRSDEEDDDIIHAGLITRQNPEAGDSVVFGNEGCAGNFEDGFSSSADPSFEVSAVPDGQADDSAPPFSQNDSYHATSLEDIASSRMPRMQKIILVLAVCAIAVFVLWCLVKNGS